MKFYIARDRDNRLYLYRDKPFKSYLMFICQCNNTKHWSELFELDESLFPEVTWENSPQEVELKINNEK